MPSLFCFLFWSQKQRLEIISGNVTNGTTENDSVFAFIFKTNFTSKKAEQNLFKHIHYAYQTRLFDMNDDK